LEAEEFDKALEKLEIHGGARMDFGGNVKVGGTGWKKTYAVQAQYRTEQFAKVLRFTEQNECRMSALVRHFGDVEDANQPCGVCDVCDPAGAVLRLFRRATGSERELAQKLIEELRGVDYKAAGTLQRSLDPLGKMSREEWDGLLGAMVQAKLIELEEAEYEKDGEVRRYRKVRLTDGGRELRMGAPLELLISDGIVEEFGRGAVAPARTKKDKAATQKGAATSVGARTLVSIEPVRLSADGEVLRVPAYVVMHDRTVTALALARPGNPKELLAIDGIGPAKVERFGEELLRLCAGK
jgi:superfamily II DNA helicase RecQ